MKIQVMLALPRVGPCPVCLLTFAVVHNAGAGPFAKGWLSLSLTLRAPGICQPGAPDPRGCGLALPFLARRSAGALGRSLERPCKLSAAISAVLSFGSKASLGFGGLSKGFSKRSLGD